MRTQTIKPYDKFSAYNSLREIKNMMLQGTIYKESHITEKNLKEITTKIFDGYNDKFGFVHFFNSLLLRIGYGDENYKKIHDLHKEIMQEEYNEVLKSI